MSEFIKIGDLAQKTCLSVRTLHYYDEIELLSPSHRNEVGHRLYSELDLIRLQQILSLRQLGFSLSEIRECLENPDFSLARIIDLHRDRLREKMALSRTLLDRLDRMARELETTQSVSVTNLMQAMEAISTIERYLTPEQQKSLADRFRQGEAEWQEMLTLARIAMRKDPFWCGTLARTTASYWQQVMKSIIGRDIELYESFAKQYQQEGVEAASRGTMDVATFEYILKAVAFRSLTDDIQNRLPVQNLTPEAMQVLHLGENAVRQIDLDVLGTEAVLLGLLAEGKSAAARVLATAGVTFEAVRHQIRELLGSHPVLPANEPLPDKLPVAPRAKRSIELAGDFAARLEPPQIAPEHLLLGILAEDRESPAQYVGVAIRILKEGFGINLAELEQQIGKATAR